MELHLTADWRVGSEIGRGGFGRVHELEDGPHLPAVAKFIPKQPGADRELLFVDLPPLVRNVVPVIDAGEHEGSWVIVMPQAELSLRDHLEGSGKVLDLDSGLQVLVDIAQTLADLDGKVVHRDLKPENVLRLDGAWCLADFGISRYAEASTAPDTHKFAMSTLAVGALNKHSSTSAACRPPLGAAPPRGLLLPARRVLPSVEQLPAS